MRQVLSSLSGTTLIRIFVVFDVDAIEAWKSYNDLDVIYEKIDYGTIPLFVDNYYGILQVSD